VQLLPVPVGSLVAHLLLRLRCYAVPRLRLQLRCCRGFAPPRAHVARLRVHCVCNGSRFTVVRYRYLYGSYGLVHVRLRLRCSYTLFAVGSRVTARSLTAAGLPLRILRARCALRYVCGYVTGLRYHVRYCQTFGTRTFPTRCAAFVVVAGFARFVAVVTIY